MYAWVLKNIKILETNQKIQSPIAKIKNKLRAKIKYCLTRGCHLWAGLSKTVILSPLQLTFHRRTLRTASGHHHHAHTRPSAVREVLWAVLFTDHLHKATAKSIRRRLHGVVLLSSLHLSWCERDTETVINCHRKQQLQPGNWKERQKEETFDFQA